MCPLILQILTYILNFKWRSFKIENKRYYRSLLCDKKFVKKQVFIVSGGGLSNN